MFYKEFPELVYNNEYVSQLVNKIVDQNLWQSIRVMKKHKNIDFEYLFDDVKNNNNRSLRRDYLKRIIFAYRLNDEELGLAQVQSKQAWIFKTELDTRVYIHKESRSVGLNFPIVFDPGKSYVGFYDDAGVELDRHTLLLPTPVYYNVEQWHAVINDSKDELRIVMSCSDLIGDWKAALEQ